MFVSGRIGWKRNYLIWHKDRWLVRICGNVIAYKIGHHWLIKIGRGRLYKIVRKIKFKVSAES